ncbi:DUF1330 domain-containing protein [Kordiimonas pumila]|uniref:DUF1330 domain-containing protein n=1 Tax=Kordiimonas pumila TaxID=2161677 RepID=A0ABV7D144_9PROT|nr:DUF1330 domain-containing protein [Kordiimonas pumila]
MSYIDPEREQFEAFKALPRDTPINMINLVKLKETAVYEDGTSVSGADAYKAYGKASGPVFTRVGGTIIWRGRPEGVLIGPLDETWDIAFIARYPNAAAFMEMVTDAEYRKAVKHRQAAVETSRLIRCADLEGATKFG